MLRNVKTKAPSNLFVSRTKSILAFITSVLLRGSPKRSVLVRFESL